MKAILFVDDHEVLARLSCEILEMQGYRAVSAYNASDALKKFDQQDFDILVTDFRMEGMNGVELAQKVRERSPNIPVIIVTGYGPIDGGKDVAARSEEHTSELQSQFHLVCRLLLEKKKKKKKGKVS